MIKKTLSNGVKVLKVSTWISAIFALLIVLVVAFFTTFPALLKAPVEQQLSEISGLDVRLSKITFDFNDEGIALKVHDIDIISTQNQHSLANIENLRWQVSLLNLFDDIYHPNKIDIDTLLLNTGVDRTNALFVMPDLKNIISNDMPEALHFVESLSINRTLIKGKYDIEIAPLVLSKNGSQFLLTVSDQSIGSQTVDISLVLSSDQLAQDGLLILPMTLTSANAKLSSNIKLYTQQGEDYFEFSGLVKRMNTVDIHHYLSAAVVGESTHQWIERAFKSGDLEDVSINITKNLSKQSPMQLNFNAHLANTELLFNSDWQTLKFLDADISTDGQRIEVMVNNTLLNDVHLQDIKVQMQDMSKKQLDVEVIGKVGGQSEQLIQFLRDAPLSDTVNEVLDQFTLSGEFSGQVDLAIPLDEREAILDIDLTIQNNLLTTLDGAVVVENYDSKLAFHDNKISTNGTGSIRNTLFDIYINPSNRNDNEEVTFALNLIDNNSGFDLYLTKLLNQSWRARVESEAIRTDVEIDLNEKDLPDVKLVGLKVTTLDKIRGDWNIEPNDFPNMYLSTEKVFVDEDELPDFSAKLKSKGNMLAINDLQFDGIGVDGEALSFNGFWVDGRTRLYANAAGKKLADFLQKLKVEEKVTGGEFDFDIRLSCECAPWNMSFKETSGMAKLKVKEGVFTEKDPGIGRILSLLNIKSIAKRLELNVSDITNEGLVYDTIDAQIILQNAIANIEQFSLSATSGAIELTGKSNIIKKEYDLRAKVLPAVSDAVPAATYLAGGGLIGLGVWLADEALFSGKIIDQIVDKVVEFKYKITGPWDAPNIENISTIL